MTGYTKLFGSIVASTIWREDDKTRIVWVTMLAMANYRGDVEASIPGLADMARVTIADAEKALVALQAPDPYSRTRDYEGRRIEQIEGGWHLLNHAKYRDKMGKDERREYLRRKQAERRARLKEEALGNCQHGVNNCSDLSTPSTHSYTDTDKSTGTKPESGTPLTTKLNTNARTGVAVATARAASLSQWTEYGASLDPSFPVSECEATYDHYERSGWKLKGGMAVKDWKAALRTCWHRWRKESMGPNGSSNSTHRHGRAIERTPMEVMEQPPDPVRERANAALLKRIKEAEKAPPPKPWTPPAP